MSYAAKEHPMLGLHVFLKIPVVGAGGRFLPFLVCPCCFFGMFLLKLLLGNNADSPRAGCCGSQGFQPCPSAPLGLFAFPSSPASTALGIQHLIQLVQVFDLHFFWESLSARCFPYSPKKAELRTAFPFSQ